MRKQYEDNVPQPMWDRPCLSAVTDSNEFDPLGSYTGRVKEYHELPVQDADDL